MRTHIFKNDPKDLLERGKQIVSSSNDAKYIHRVTLVNLLLAGGMSAAELGRLSGVSERTLRTWVTTADEAGFEKLKAVKQEGRPSKLNESQTAEIKDALQKDPLEFGYKVWDGPTLSTFIKDKYDIELGIRQCQRLFHNLGFSLIRPQTYPSLGGQNEDQRNEFKKK